jgi:hypothetical protein
LGQIYHDRVFYGFPKPQLGYVVVPRQMPYFHIPFPNPAEFLNYQIHKIVRSRCFCLCRWPAVYRRAGHVQAAERKDGKWDVWLPGGTTGGGNYFACSLEDYVEVVTEADATPWPEFLATSLSCPAFSVGKHPAWRPIPADNLGPPDQILIELDKLESLPQPQFPPRVETRTMSLAKWRRLNGEGVEVEPAPVAVAAE